MTKVPPKLRAGILAVLVASGGGYAALSHIDGETTSLLRNQYVQAVAQDGGTSEALPSAVALPEFFRGGEFVER